MSNHSNIERAVMRRVHTIHILRPLISSGMLAALVLMAALWGIGREVWVARVFQNMPHSANFEALTRFYVDAFSHTRLIVQALTILTLASVIYLARETARLLSSLASLARI